MKRASIVLCLLAATLIVEAMLAFRLWIQVTAQPVEAQSSLSLMSLSDKLALPFRFVTGKAPLSATGVIDYTLLTAMEGYFIALLALLFLTFVFGRTTGWLAAHSSRPVPRFVIVETSLSHRRVALQTIHSTLHEGVRFFARADGKVVVEPYTVEPVEEDDEAPIWT